MMIGNGGYMWATEEQKVKSGGPQKRRTEIFHEIWCQKAKTHSYIKQDTYNNNK